MSDTRQGDSERALARLLAEALRSPDDVTNDSACPDAELLAAYADHNLDATENALWEEHFSECARCQKILAVLAVSGEEPLTETEVARFGRLAAAAAGGATERQARAVEAKNVAPFARPRTALRWLAPAVGIAAAAALWIALRPAPPRGTPTLTAQKTVAEPAAPSDLRLEARANLPAPPSAASRESEPQRLKSPAQPVQEKKESESAVSVPQQSAAPAAVAPSSAQVAGGLRGTADQPPTANSPQAKLTDELPSAAPAPPPQAVPGAGAAADAAAAQTAAPAEAREAQAKTSGNRAAQNFAARGLFGSLAARTPVVVAPPSHSVLWRLGLGGRIERSADQGRTWQEQSSGVTNDLLAGSALSDKVVWIAGRAGVILRTIDGEHWQRVASPVPAADWTAIEASDALHSTIMSSDGRRFATADAGQTWKQQQ
jgi:photosynthesis system II assembly factor YCF48-like protein